MASRSPKKKPASPHPLQEMGTISTLIVEHSPVGKLLLDGEGNILYMNPKAQSIFGYSQKELRGKRLEALLPERYRQAHLGQRASFMAHPSPRPMGVGRHLFALHKNGQEFPVEIGLVPLKTAAGDVVVLASVVDVTAQKEREQLEKELLHRTEAEQRRIGQDLHDTLGQELLAISFLCNVHKKKLSAQGSSETADAAQLEELVNQAKVNLRKLSRGLYSADLESRGLGGALKDLASNVRDMNTIPCEFKGDETIRLKDRSIAEHLYKLAQEAVNNAVKHSFAKTITISLTKTDHQLVLSIRDNGIGLPSSAHHAGGLGLGTMSYRANVIGATLDIKADPKGGTTVTCSVHVS